MSVITKDLGIASAYGYAKSKGYTGTEEEFAELMASYADVAQQAEAAAQDAEDAKDAAVSAKNDAVTAKTAAQAAQSAAETASGTATTKASEAAQSAQSAAGFASAAQTSATAASGSASTAQTAAQTATNKASEASSSASAASTAKTGAETARTGAQTAQANAEAAASSVSASAAQIEQNTEDIAGLKNDFMQFPSGNYPEMGAGYANQLVSGLKKEDSTPYNFRKVPYDATLEEVKKIVGGTVANNQLMMRSKYNAGTDAGVSHTIDDDGITMTLNGTATGSFRVTSSVMTTGRKFYVADVNHIVRLGDGYSFGVETGGGIISPTGTSLYVLASNGTVFDNTKIKIVVIDLTQMFGTAIADYIYTLETATAGAGVAWLKTHFPKQFDAGYQAYDAGTLKSIEGLTAHQTVADGTTHIYALDSSLTLRGISKLDSNNNLYYDGDEYLPDGTVNRYWAERAYQSGDESDGSTMITDGTKTVYKLATPATETADPYTTPQIIAPDGTEEYIYEDGAFELPVGHSSDYPVDVSGQLDDILDTPSANGTYVLKATVTDGAVSYSWVADA